MDKATADVLNVNAAPDTSTNGEVYGPPALDPKEAARRERVVARRLAAAVSATATERAARNAAAREAGEGLEGTERREAVKLARREDKAERSAAAANAASRVSFLMPKLDDRGTGTALTTVEYVDPTTGRFTRAAVEIRIKVRDSITLTGAGLAAIDLD